MNPDLKIYGLGESCIRSGYPCADNGPSGQPDDIGMANDDIIRAYKLAKQNREYGHNNVVLFNLTYFIRNISHRRHSFIISSDYKAHKARCTG